MGSVHHPLAPAAAGNRAWRREQRDVTVAPVGATCWRPLSAVGVSCAAATVVTRLVAPGVLDRSSVAIGIVGILLGVPHGAVDHLVPFWVSGRRITVGGLLRVVTPYLLVAVLATGALVLAPTLTLTVFLIASALHFGRAEVEFVAERHASPARRSPRTDHLRAAAHGLTVVALPIALWPDRVHDLLTTLAPALAGRNAGLAFDVVAVSAVCLDLGLLLVDLAGHRREEAAETVLLVLLMALVPPLPAFGVYFGAWHALRHTARLLTLPGPDGVVLSVQAALRRYVVHALAPTVVVLLTLFAVACTDSRSVLTSALVVLIALTFPHMRTVAALDRTRHSTQSSPIAAPSAARRAA
jgi:Brp/Blh family beta-carotene 15,15'-monooxygenase